MRLLATAITKKRYESLRGKKMDFRGAMQVLFGKPKAVAKLSSWKEVGNYTSVFSNVGSDLYASVVVRACIRTLAEHTS